MTQHHRMLSFVVTCGIVAVAVISVVYRDQPLAWLGIGMTFVFLISMIVSGPGMARRPGSRFKVEPGFLMQFEHPWRKMEAREAERQWLNLTGGSMTLESGWGCRTCELQRFIVRSTDGRKCHILVNMPRGPWPAWGVGLFVTFGADPRPEFAELVETGSTA